MKFKKDRTQLFNPRGFWVKIDTKNGRVLGHKTTPWKTVRKASKKSSQ